MDRSSSSTSSSSSRIKSLSYSGPEEGSRYRRDDDNDSSSEELRRQQRTGQRSHKTRSTEPDGSSADQIIRIPDKKSLAARLNADIDDGRGRFMSEQQFRQYATNICLPKEICDALINDVHAFVSSFIELSEEEKSVIKEKEKFAEDLKRLPVEKSNCRQIKTTLTAGAAAYWTSFFLAKLALNLSTIPTASIHGCWSYLVAGLLNPMLSEPMAQGIRVSGAVYGSPDGKAYTEFHTAAEWMAATLQNPKECEKWRKKIAEIVTSVLQRENKKGIRRLGSGVASVEFDGDGFPVSAKSVNGQVMDPNKAIEQVILWARRRAYITDEIPFYFFSLNYTVSGALAPIFKLTLPTWGYFCADMALSAFLGTLSGMETAAVQNFLRGYIQGAKLDAFAPEHKRALQSAAHHKQTIYEEKMARLKQLRALLMAVRQDLNMKKKQGADVHDDLKVINQNIQEIKQAYRAVRKQYLAIKRKFNQHNSALGRMGQAVTSSMSNYMGEFGLKANAPSVQSTSIKAASKWLGYTTSLIPFVLWVAYASPYLVQNLLKSGSNSVPSNSGNFSDFNGVSNLTYAVNGASAATSATDKLEELNLLSTLGALNGIPLILGYTMRQQYLSRGFESILIKIFGRVPVPKDNENDNDAKKSTDSSNNTAADSDWSDDRDDGSVIVSSASDEDFSSDSSNEDDGSVTTPSRMEQGIRGRQKKVANEKIDGSDDDDYSTANEGTDGSSESESDSDASVLT